MGELRVWVQARAARTEIAGQRAGGLLVRVTAPPVGGRANDAVRKLVAKRLGVAASRVAIARGARARDKLLRIDGVESGMVRRKLGLEG
jgi:uncharacterized protein YggU (UPF0235/DUF167 family)